MIDTAMRNLKVLWRADSIIAEIRLKQIMNRTGIRAVAAFMLGLALVMFNIAAFFALLSQLGQVWSSLIVGFADLVLAGVVAKLASGVRSGRELELALDTRRVALDALEGDAQVIQRQLMEIRDDVQKTSGAVFKIANDPLYSALPNLIVPLTGILLKVLKKSDDAPAGPESH